MATLVETQTNPRLAFQNWLLIVNTVRTVIEYWTLDCRANLSPTDFIDWTVLPILPEQNTSFAYKILDILLSAFKQAIRFSRQSSRKTLRVIPWGMQRASTS